MANGLPLGLIKKDLPQPRTKTYLLKRSCQCIGLASLILVMNYGDLLGGGTDVRMHVPFRLTGIVLAQLADILVLGFVLFAVLVPLSRTRIYPWVRLAVAIVMPPYLMWRMQALSPFAMAHGLVPIFAAVWAVLVLVLLLRFSRVYNNLMRFADGIGVFFALFALCSVMQLLWVVSWKPAPNQHLAAWSTVPQPPRQHPLLVWIVFDELSYDQVFGHRAHELALPNFDALRSQSSVFTNVQPAGYKTAKIIPSLLSGHVVDDFRYGFDNSFRVHYQDARGWHTLNGSQTVFNDAQKNGWRTAVVGWYNPYCTIYGDAIDNCYWNNLDRIDGPMAQRDTFLRNASSPLEQMAREIQSPTRAEHIACSYDVRQRLSSHLDLEQHWLQLLHTDQADFVFLHIAVPHSPNIWSRVKGNYTQTCDASYLDNLALADQELGRALSILQASPRWKDTTLIVQGDHSWRIGLWNWLPAWTEEDHRASREVFDPRPAVLIHEAGQTQPRINGTAWPLMNVHSVIEQVVSGQTLRY